MREEHDLSGERAPAAASNPRLVSDAPAADPRFASDVHYYLSLEPRQLPSRYLYDALGSALFDAICRLPWYRVTRAEERLLAAHAADIFARAGALARIVELGPGNGEKLAMLIQRARGRAGALDVELIDVSPSALLQAERTLAALGGIRVRTRERSYEAGLMDLAADAPADGRTLMVFLGSNIGNFDRPAAEAFLRSMRASLRPGDALLLGADLVKPENELLRAYDDPLGVTAAFNRNILVRINRELGGDFALNGFGHRAVWNARESRVEMHLVSRMSQRVTIPGAQLAITFRPGDVIWTESSYKFERDDVSARLQQARFERVADWVDEEDRFALMLARAV